VTRKIRDKTIDQLRTETAFKLERQRQVRDLRKYGFTVKEVGTLFSVTDCAIYAWLKWEPELFYSPVSLPLIQNRPRYSRPRFRSLKRIR
jgi:hypothetical protein